ncbi:MAG: MFS transporter [Chitinophagales bacterium]
MKNKQALFFLFSANSVSGMAQGISMIAIPWYFSNQLEKPALFGKIYLIIAFLSLFWGLYSGTLIDRFNRKNIMQVYTLVGTVFLSVVAAVGMLNGFVPALLVAMVFGFTFLIYNIHYPNLYAFLQEITEPKNYSRITSYIEIQGQTTTAFAGALAAILLAGTKDGTLNLLGFAIPVGFEIQPWSLQKVFMLNASTYLIAFFLVSQIRFVPFSTRVKEIQTVYERVRTGLIFLRKNPLLFLFGNATFGVFLGVLISNFYLKPIYIKQHLLQAADVYAAYEMYFAFGSVLAGLAITRIFYGFTMVKAVIILSVCGGAIFVFNSFNTNLFWFYAVTFLLGLCNAGIRIMRVTYFFKNIPNQLIGRSSSVFMTMNVLFRIVIVALISNAFFTTEGRVVWVYFVFGIVVILAALSLIPFYKKLVNLKPKLPDALQDLLEKDLKQ